MESMGVTSGEAPKPMNKPTDAPTIVVDGMTGAMASAYMVRLHCVQHISWDSEMHAKHVVSLAFDVEQFGKFVDAVVQIRDQVRPPAAAKP